jgi:hypothetical protein
MVASNRTIMDVLRVLHKHLDNDTIDRILGDLGCVSGNTSFRETITNLQVMNKDFKE